VPTDCVIEPNPCDCHGYADAFILLEERNADLWRAVDQLSEKCAALLRALGTDPPPTYEDIASRFGMPIGSVGPTRMRCLDCLRRRLALLRIRQDWDDL
jgi:DNA-directed RNA polymerase specialized sigma24 family protein